MAKIVRFTVLSDREEQFILTALREARKNYREKNPVPRNKGGRPSLQSKVWTACDDVWKEWGQRFPRHHSTMTALLQKVADKIPGDRIDQRRIENHVRSWISCHLTVDEVPKSWLTTKEGRRVAKVDAFLKSPKTQAAVQQLLETRALVNCLL